MLCCCHVRCCPLPLLPGWLIFMGIFTYLLVPETKGVPIEAIEDKFRQHWFWKRVMARTDAAEEAAAAKVSPAGPAGEHELHAGHEEPVCKVVKAEKGGHGIKL